MFGAAGPTLQRKASCASKDEFERKVAYWQAVDAKRMRAEKESRKGRHRLCDGTQQAAPAFSELPQSLLAVREPRGDEARWVQDFRTYSEWSPPEPQRSLMQRVLASIRKPWKYGCHGVSHK
uniref:Uncharacterized protein n=1 Tax=Alexandrium catenella TaxID=2925 RepID=A0A7S1PZW5_ALECA|mmetsp:Transcript_118317/g.314884  ORF Transcript_118317/g.314884 Transcript_118317/m.314884 type:complete len:122 (+) Transcript_118317:124-489(+)